MDQGYILSVSEYIAILNESLKATAAKVSGEVTEVKVWSSGHVYFVLKDEHDGAVLNCVIWKSDYQLFGIHLAVGMKIIVSGHPNIYANSGKLSFIVRSLELVGDGLLKKAYDELKMKLEKEGIFLESTKVPLPSFPQKVGVITSRNGAVIHDFMNNLSRHGFEISFHDSRVEGMEALPDLYRAIRTMKQRDVEVIVLMRGGGSLQSLAAYNAESLIREVATCSIPIIAAIGHDQDVPLCALAADTMVSTPTAAANLLNKSWDHGYQTLQIDSQKIIMRYTTLIGNIDTTLQVAQIKIGEKFERILSIFSYTSDHLADYLGKIDRSMQAAKQMIALDIQGIFTHFADTLIATSDDTGTLMKGKILRSFLAGLQRATEDITSTTRFINANDPRRQLALGFSLIRNKGGRLVKSTKDVTIGELLELTAADGLIDTTVTAIKENHD